MKMKEKGTQTDFVLLINENLQTPSPPPISDDDDDDDDDEGSSVFVWLSFYPLINVLTHSLSHPICFFFFSKNMKM